MLDRLSVQHGLGLLRSRKRDHVVEVFPESFNLDDLALFFLREEIAYRLFIVHVRYEQCIALLLFSLGPSYSPLNIFCL